MELKEFVKAALNDVMDAVQETIEERKADRRHGYVNPKTHDFGEMEVDTIKFDIAVSTGNKAKGGASASLEVFSVKLGGEGGGEREQSNVSRIEFTLAVAWPHTHITDAKKLVRAR
ncbi:hypothetical protein LB566_01255 [Mesorhizobium sp. CA13]|uniref:trypco2 family protein n=1 Tax=Mesorhizobium sp. CA13 TaxID=2876643 RepID=UPI001CC9DF71|nr:trypco2 family protein [Mesorhizobium sp. CA13]MBZ9852406.1 hypothetical protein [Mesorhizobium sp. CA13]